MYNNSDWAALYSNLRKAQIIWGLLEKVLGKTRAPIKAQEMMYKAVVQEVLMYGSEIWVVIYMMMAIIEGLHHSIGRRIVEMTAWRGDGGEW